MAGEWLKFEASTPEKPEVLAITVGMGWDDPDLTVGKLLRVWRWFDQQTVDGNAAGVTPALLDRMIGVSGLCGEMQKVGWLEVHDGGVRLPGFEKHNGNTAKKRVLTAKRVAKHKTNASGNDGTNARSVSEALPREEKSREDIDKDKDKNNSAPASRSPSLSVSDLVDLGVDQQVAAEFLALRKAKRSRLTPLALQGILREAERVGWSLDQTLRKCVERGWQGFEASWVQGKSKPVSQIENFEAKTYVGTDESAISWAN